VNAHKNARTTPYVRELMAARRAEGWPAAEIAEAAGVSVRTVYKWLARKTAETRSSRARRLANRLSAPLIEEIARLRRERRLTAAQIARRLRLARSTVAGWLARLGMGRLKLIDPKAPVQRYERARAGELIHLDIKKLGRFKRIGHRITGDRTGQSNARGIGWDFVHVAIDDATRMAYAEILPDEKQDSATAFLNRALIWMRSHRVTVEQVMTDNGSAYRSKLFAAALKRANARHLRTRPYTPRTNGKAERFIQTLLREWAYAKPYASSGRRNAALAPFIDRYNRRRPHASLDGQSPAQALQLKR
jgi:transposase InsO family protein